MKDCRMIADEIVNLIECKNADYGNSFAKSVDEYGYAAYLIRLGDKVNRLKNLTKEGAVPQVHDESIEDTIKDIVGYSLLMLEQLGN